MDVHEKHVHFESGKIFNGVNQGTVISLLVFKLYTVANALSKPVPIIGFVLCANLDSPAL